MEIINHSALNVTSDYTKEVHTGESKLVNQNGFLFYTYEGVHYLMGYVGTQTALTLPADYNGEAYTVYQYAFYRNTSITSIVVPEGVKEIGSHAFKACTSLVSIELPHSLQKIDDLILLECSALMMIKFNGTSEEWKILDKGYEWDYLTGEYSIVCTDKILSKS